MLLSKSFDCSDSCMKRMRYSMERFVFLPFSMAGCASSSSVADHKRPHHQQQPPRKAAKSAQTNNPPVARRELVAKESTSSTKSKSYSTSWALPRPNIARRMQRLIKSFSQIFVYKEEEEEREMEIGFPTDVKHVTHIGLDGLTTITNNPVKKGNNTTWDIDIGIDGAPDHVTSFPSISLDEYEQAMAAQARASPPPV